MFFPNSGEQIQKYLDSLPNSLDVCGRKPYPETGKSCGLKNIRIRLDRALVTSSIRISRSFSRPIIVYLTFSVNINGIAYSIYIMHIININCYYFLKHRRGAGILNPRI